jgi:hypothetical protein
MDEKLFEESLEAGTKQLTLEDLLSVRGGAGQVELLGGDIELLGVKSAKAT